MLNLERRSRKPSLLGFLGGMLAAAAIGLSAYASHGVADPPAQSHLSTAAAYAFVHGLALALLGPQSLNAVARLSLYVLLLGTLLFSGSLVVGALLQWSTQLAPVGGITLMAGWVVYAVGALKR